MECWWEGGVGQRRIKGRKKWDNCNSIINKVDFKKKEKKQLIDLSNWRIQCKQMPKLNKIGHGYLWY